MEKQRYAESDENSFYGQYLYDQIVPAKHFLRMLNEIIDWKRYTRKLIRLYKGEGVVGRPPLYCGFALEQGALYLTRISKD